MRAHAPAWYHHALEPEHILLLLQQGTNQELVVRGDVVVKIKGEILQAISEAIAAGDGDKAQWFTNYLAFFEGAVRPRRS